MPSRCVEWNRGDTITGRESDSLVTEAREMSMNVSRTHTTPLPPLWTDICDENGDMILAERILTSMLQGAQRRGKQ